MYQKYYHLRRAPFQLTVDPDFFWPGAGYEKALEAMGYGLGHRGGLTLLSGDAGVGKTAVVHALFRRLQAEGRRILTALVPDPCQTEQEFFNLVLAALGIGARVRDREDFHDRLLGYLEETGGQGRQVLLVIDEAQRLVDSVIREVDALLDLGPGPAGGLCICLVGRISDSRALMELVGGVFANRVMVSCHLSPLTAGESADYIRHRLRLAGAESDIFTGDALQEVHRFAEGYPGLINALCDFALFSAYNRDLPRVTAEVVRSSGASLRLAEEQRESGVGNGTASREGHAREEIAGEAGNRDDGGEMAAGEETETVASAREETGRDHAGEAAGSGGPELSAPRARFPVISSFGALAAVVFLVSGYLYVQHNNNRAWSPPAEPTSAGLPAPVPPVADQDEPPPPGTDTSAEEVTAVSPEPEAEAEPQRQPPAHGAGNDGSVPATADPADMEPAPAEPVVTETGAAGERKTHDAGRGTAPAGTGPVVGQATGHVPRPETLSPALKTLLAGGSLAGDPTLRRLPPVRINAGSGRPQHAGTEEKETVPDPADVIDWLLKKKRHREPAR